jgi:hypothetical protein
MWWRNFIKLTGLILLGVAVLIVLLPVIILSLEVVLIAAGLLLAGFLSVKLKLGAQHLYTWFDQHHWIIHRHSGPNLRIH